MTTPVFCFLFTPPLILFNLHLHQSQFTFNLTVTYCFIKAKLSKLSYILLKTSRYFLKYSSHYSNKLFPELGFFSIWVRLLFFSAMEIFPRSHFGRLCVCVCVYTPLNGLICIPTWHMKKVINSKDSNFQKLVFAYPILAKCLKN